MRELRADVLVGQSYQIIMGFDIHGKEELNRLVDKLRKIEGVTDIMRATG